MPVRNGQSNVGYGLTNALQDLSPQPIISQRAPTTRDFAEIGTIWVDQPRNDSFILTSVVANSASWINAGGGTGTFNNLEVVNTVTFDAMGLGMLTSSAVGVISSINGTNGQLIIGGTAVAPIWGSVTSGDGSVVIAVGANTLDLVVSGAAASTFPTDAGTATPNLGATTIAGGTNIDTSGAASTVTINVVNGPSFSGGLTVTAGTTTITSNTNGAQAIYLHADGGANETIQIHADQGSTVDSVNILSDVGGITLQSVGLASDDAINLEADIGGIDIDAALQINIASSEAAVDAIVLNASNAAGGIDVDTGTGGINIATTGSFTILGDVNSVIDVEGAGIDLTLSSDAGRVIVNGEEAANNAITLLSVAGGLDTNVALQMNLDSSQAAATAIVINASNAAGGIDIDSGTAGIIADTTGGISLDSAAASNFTATGAFDITLSSTAGSMIIDGGEAAVDAINIDASNAAGGVDIDAGTGGITIDTTGAISLDAAAASNFTATGAFDVTVSSTAGSIVVDGGEAAINAIQLTASNAAGGLDLNAGTGGITVDTTGILSLDSAGTTNLTATGAFDVTVSSTAGSVNVTGGEADVAAISIQAAAGGVDIDGALQVSMVSSEAAGTAIVIDASNAAGGIDMDDGGGGTTIDSAAGISIDAATASNFSTAAGDLTLAAATNSVNITAVEAVTNAVFISASSATGGVTIDYGDNIGITLDNGTQTAKILHGDGDPNTVVTAPQGSVWFRTDGGAGTAIYSNTDGVTAWAAVA